MFNSLECTYGPDYAACVCLGLTRGKISTDVRLFKADFLLATEGELSLQQRKQNDAELPHSGGVSPVAPEQEPLRAAVGNGSYNTHSHRDTKNCATAKVDEPDTWDVRARLKENVVQLDVPVEDPFGVDFNESIHQLSYYGLLEIEIYMKTDWQALTAGAAKLTPCDTSPCETDDCCQTQKKAPREDEGRPQQSHQQTNEQDNAGQETGDSRRLDELRQLCNGMRNVLDLDVAPLRQLFYGKLVKLQTAATIQASMSSHLNMAASMSSHLNMAASMSSHLNMAASMSSHLNMAASMSSHLNMAASMSSHLNMAASMCVGSPEEERGKPEASKSVADQLEVKPLCGVTG
ncbi:hypothetical protein EYF80_047772 [Liparis tanakae]|uniref:Uncharacterized protein n=1 Tax=Liparis tanakae TaxID=230148 RepID=A0A4Z2FMB8_9TELE|nr:hypothetical protein EYF80_047772 [Liparis tanakae]